MTRAAIVYLGAVLASGCGPESTSDGEGPERGEEAVLQPYGAPPDPEPVPEVEPPPEEDAPEEAAPAEAEE